jgi:predicted membrane chloride channel (bestrophin family)
VDGIDQKKYQGLFQSLLVLQKNLVGVLSQTNTLQIQDIRKDRKEIFYALESYKKFYNEREKDSIIRVKNELFESVEKLHNLRLHATPVSLRMYCLIFIYLSPLVYNSHILANFEKNSLLELGIALFFSVLIGFILMALYNIQEYIEDPFDQQGLDDLKFREMSVGEEEILS